MSKRDDTVPTPPGRLGSHLLVDAWQAPAERLDDAEGIKAAVLQAVEAAGATLIDLCVHRFNPRGVTAVAALAESHLAVHTWPELGYFAADLFFCGRGDPQRAVDSLIASLGAGKVQVRTVQRGAAVSVEEAVETTEGVA